MKGSQGNVLKRPPSGGWGKKQASTEKYKELGDEHKGTSVSARNSRSFSMINTPNGSHVVLDEPVAKTRVSSPLSCLLKPLTRQWAWIARKDLRISAQRIYCDALAIIHCTCPCSPLDSWYTLVDKPPKSKREAISSVF